LNCFFVPVVDSKLTTIISSDLETTLEIKNSRDLQRRKGSFAVAADLIMEIVKSLDDAIVLNFQKKN
jgi:DNA polymerase III sliding clamp (beta) subunit (PCNA family)